MRGYCISTLWRYVPIAIINCVHTKCYLRCTSQQSVLQVVYTPPKSCIIKESSKPKHFWFMRKLEKQMNFALSNKGNWAGSNTTVLYNEATNCSQVLLHGHNIATLDHTTNALKISSCGYETVTTKSRLNAILEELRYGCKVFQKNFDWYFKSVNQTVDFWDGMIITNDAIPQVIWYT